MRVPIFVISLDVMVLQYLQFHLNQAVARGNEVRCTVAENGGTEKTELLLIKTDILPLEIMRYFRNFVFVFKKKTKT